MNYSFNMQTLGNAFPLPGAVVDNHIKLATHLQLKVILFAYRHLGEGINPERIATELGEDVADIEDALVFWSGLNILVSEVPETTERGIKSATPKISLPTREDVSRRGMEDNNVKLLMQEAQTHFGRFLKQNESSFLLSLYDDCDMDVTVILFMLSYASSQGKCNLSYIKSLSKRWLKEGISDISAAEKSVADMAKENMAWSVVCSAFGIEKRIPSEKESTLSNKWINEWQLSKETLKSAYDVCVDTKSRFNFAYTASVLENWHKDGIKDKKQAEEKKPQGKKKNDYAGFDLDKFEEMLNNNQ